MKAIVLASPRESIFSSNNKNEFSIPLNCDSLNFVKRKLNYLKNFEIDELIVVKGLGFQKCDDFFKDCNELEIRINIIHNPFYKNTNSLVEIWMAISEINDDVLIMNWNSVFKQDTIESFIKYGDRKSCFLIDREASCEHEVMNRNEQDRDLVKINNHTILKNRILRGSVCLSMFRGTGVRSIRESIEEEIRTDGAKKKEFVSAIYRFIKKQHMVCKVKSLEIGELFKIYMDYHRNAFKDRLIFNDRFGKKHRKTNFQVLKSKGE